MVGQCIFGYDTAMEYRAYESDSLELNPSSPFFWDHLSRYWWVSSLVSGQTVLDCACGKGYGTYVLSHQAKFSYGIDLNQKSLEIAAKNFGKKENLSFSSWDVTKISSLPQPIDAVVAFEVIEHLPPPLTHNFLEGIQKKLSSHGTLYLSTPNHDVVLKSGMSVPEFHINNFRSYELKSLLEKYFRNVEMLGQFQPRSPFQQMVFDLDFWNLRHLTKYGRLAKEALVGLGSKDLGAKDSVSLSTAASVPDTHRTNAPSPESWRHLLEVYPEEAKNYRFSPRHWRQSGLTVAIAHNR